MKNIIKLGNELGLTDNMLIPYGWDKAKIDVSYMPNFKWNKNGKLVLVTAGTPTKAGEGKTTTTIGLHDGLRKIGVKSLACLREPSLGPCFGVKGGAVGALKSTIVPEDDINLHFTGDMHALTSTVNLIAAMIENAMYQGTIKNIKEIVWPRALDMNDRSLRDIRIVYNDKKLKDIHSSEFVITVASELMAIFCLAVDEEDFLDRAEDMIVAYAYDDNGQEYPVYVKDLRIRGAIKKLMHQAMSPNLVQTLEENPVLIHGGPFANIAHGCNSLIATKLALKLADVVVTEAGFGADLGAEKFLDIKCQEGNLKPDCVVLVATVRALKLHGGVKFEDLGAEDIGAMSYGFCNLKQHYDNLVKFGVPVVVAINRFPSDTDAEISALEDILVCNDIEYALNEAALKGSEGAVDLAKIVEKTLNEKESDYKPLYDRKDLPIKEKIDKICKEIYRAENVEYTEEALKKIEKFEKAGYGDFYVCMAKTPNSFTDDPKALGAPEHHTVHIRDVKVSRGAKFIIPLTGEIMRMPGLPKEPLACKM